MNLDETNVFVISYPNVKQGAQPLSNDLFDPSKDTITQFLSGPAYIRNQVFVIEQKCNPLNEMDDLDEKSVHVYASYNGKPIGTARTFLYKDDICKIGRMAVLKEFRNRGFGTLILNAIETQAKNILKAKSLVLNAQKTSLIYYSKNGYVHDESAGEWLEEGMVHVKMIKYL